MSEKQIEWGAKVQNPMSEEQSSLIANVWGAIVEEQTAKSGCLWPGTEGLSVQMDPHGYNVSMDISQLVGELRMQMKRKIMKYSKY